jgi:Sugar phosphate permease
LFNLATGISFVAVPLLALQARYTATQIGLLIALSAVSQMIARGFMGPLLRRRPDRVFVVTACVLTALSCGVLAVSTSVVAFVAAELAQGLARAMFWTGIQTHVVRAARTAVGGLTLVNIAGGVGSLVGPIVAGLLSEVSPEVALMGGVAVGVGSVVPAVMLIKLPVFEKARRESGMIWRRPGVSAACWTAVGTGTWKGVLNSYVPVALALASQSSTTIGILIATGNGACLLGTAVSGWVKRFGTNGSLLIGIVCTGAGTAAIGPTASLTIAVAIALVISGIGAGVLQTVGPAVAAEVVHPQEQGDVIASVGLFRAAALFAAPAGMAGMVLIAPLSVAFVVVGGLVMLPALSLRKFALRT